MKTMLWMRHGKSDWDASYGRDHDRPLAKRGVKAAKAMGTALARADLAPHFVLSSTAVRARTTAELAMAAVADELGSWSVPTRHEGDLYGGGLSSILEHVQRVPDDADGRPVERLLITGHEPTWSSLVSQLIGGGDVRMVTAAVACVQCHVDRWQDVRPGRCELVFFLPPKVLAKLC